MTEAHFHDGTLTVSISENDMPEIPPVHWWLTVGGSEFRGVLESPPKVESDGRLTYGISMRQVVP